MLHWESPCSSILRGADYRCARVSGCPIFPGVFSGLAVSVAVHPVVSRLSNCVAVTASCRTWLTFSHFTRRCLASGMTLLRSGSVFTSLIQSSITLAVLTNIGNFVSECAGATLDSAGTGLVSGDCVTQYINSVSERLRARWLGAVIADSSALHNLAKRFPVVFLSASFCC